MNISSSSSIASSFVRPAVATPGATTYPDSNINYTQDTQDIQTAQTTLSNSGGTSGSTSLSDSHTALRHDIHAIVEDIKANKGQFKGDHQLWSTLKSLITTQKSVIAATQAGGSTGSTTYPDSNINYTQDATDLSNAQGALTGTGSTTLDAAHSSLAVDIHAFTKDIAANKGQFGGDKQLWNTLKSLIDTQKQVIAANKAAGGTFTSASVDLTA